MNTNLHENNIPQLDQPPRTATTSGPPQMLRMAAGLTGVGVVIFIVATIAAHLARTDLNPLIDPVSLYSLGDTGWIMTTGKVAVGLAGLSVLASSRGLSIAGRVSLALWATMSLTATAFPMDAPGAPATTSGIIHEWAGFDFVFAIAAALFFARSFKRGDYGVWGQRARTSAKLLTASGISLVLFMGALHNLDLGGLAQRADWLVFLTWLATLQMAVLAGRTGDARDGSSPQHDAVLTAARA